MRHSPTASASPRTRGTITPTRRPCKGLIDAFPRKGVGRLEHQAANIPFLNRHSTTRSPSPHHRRHRAHASVRGRKTDASRACPTPRKAAFTRSGARGWRPEEIIASDTARSPECLTSSGAPVRQHRAPDPGAWVRRSAGAKHLAEHRVDHRKQATTPEHRHARPPAPEHPGCLPSLAAGRVAPKDPVSPMPRVRGDLARRGETAHPLNDSQQRVNEPASHRVHATRVSSSVSSSFREARAK